MPMRGSGRKSCMKEMKLALVLFKGTGSVDRALEKAGFHVDTLDIDPKCNATWTSDIMQWDDWRRIDPGTYDFVWGSPPCTEYSIARTTAKTPRNLELADSIVARTLEIIRYLQPKCWLIENPQTGYLKTRDVIQGLPWRDITYCMYSDGEKHTYKKQTRLWGHLPTFVPRTPMHQEYPLSMERGHRKAPYISPTVQSWLLCGTSTYPQRALQHARAALQRDC